MKKILVILLIFYLAKSHACDICGCGAGSNYIGILPEFHKHIFGLRHRYNSLTSHVGLGGVNTYLTKEEMCRTTEIWGGWNIGKKFRLMAVVPYAFNEIANHGINKSKNGIGDVSANAFYQLLNKRNTVLLNKLLVQSFWIGGGIKLPTGEYSPVDKVNTSQNTNLFQPGTASTDFSLNAMYDARIQDVGINISGGYKMNTTNKYKYSYGNKLTAAAQLYYKVKVLKKITVAPNVGFMYERSKKDIDNKILADISGGTLTLGSVGFEAANKKISVGANWQTPLSQNLANGIVRANNRMMIHISFLL